MVKSIGRNININDEAVLSDAIVLGVTSEKIADADPERIFFHVTNNASNQAVWIKLQPTADDDDMKGIFLGSKNSGNNSWEMPMDNIYTGEICAVADSGTPSVYVTEY